MITRTTLQGVNAPQSAIGLRAEIMILSIITIFGIIGLSFCIGLNGPCDDCSAEYKTAQSTQTVVYDQQSET